MMYGLGSGLRTHSKSVLSQCRIIYIVSVEACAYFSHMLLTIVESYLLVKLIFTSSAIEVCASQVSRQFILAISTVFIH